MKNTITCAYLRIVVSKTISITATLATSGIFYTCLFLYICLCIFLFRGERVKFSHTVNQYQYIHSWAFLFMLIVWFGLVALNATFKNISVICDHQHK
jgi:amino acid permease